MGHRTLRRRGVRGCPQVRIDGDALSIKAATELAIPLARIEHARIGPVFGKRTHYAATVRVAGEAAPLQLNTIRSPAEFSEAMRRLASVVIAKRGIGAVEGGTPLWRNLPTIVPLSASFAVMGYYLGELIGLGFAAKITLALVGVAALTPVWREAFENAPRRIVSLHELEKYLPRPAPPPGQGGGLTT